MFQNFCTFLGCGYMWNNWATPAGLFRPKKLNKSCQTILAVRIILFLFQTWVRVELFPTWTRCAKKFFLVGRSTKSETIWSFFLNFISNHGATRSLHVRNVLLSLYQSTVGHGRHEHLALPSISHKRHNAISSSSVKSSWSGPRWLLLTVLL